MTLNRNTGTDVDRGESEAALQEWRAKTLYLVLIVVAVLGLPSYAYTIWNAVQSGQMPAPLLWIYLVAYLAFVGLAAFPRLDFRVRGWVFLSLAYVNAVASLARVGLAGSGRLYLITLPIIAVLVIGARTGYIAAALSLVIYTAFAALAHLGLLGNWLTVQDNPLDLPFWIEAGTALAVFVILLVVLLERFHRLQVRTLAAKHETVAKLAETALALREREERLAVAMEVINDGIWDWDIRTDEVYYSPRWKSMLGYADHEIANRFDEWRRRVHPDDLGLSLAEVQAHLEGRTPVFQLEHRLQHKDGSYRCILARGVAFRDADGEPYRMAGSHTDVTERRRAEEALRESEGNMRSLLENARNFAVYRIAVDPSDPHLARVLVASPSMHDLFGVPDLYDFSSWFDAIHPDDLPRIVEANRRSLETGVPFDQQMRFFNNEQGEWTWAQVTSTPVFDAEGRLTHFNGLVVDITEQKRAEQTLQRRLAFEELVASISTEFVNLGPHEVDAGVQHALKLIGEFDGADRSYVFLLSGDGTAMTNTHEWCAEGIESNIDRVQDVSVNTFPWLMERLRQFDVVHVHRVADLPPEASAEREEFQAQAIQSLLCVPMAYRGALIGFVGFDVVRGERTWTEDSVALLRMAGEIFVNALEHKRAQAIQAGQRQFLELLAMGGNFRKMLHTLVRLVEGQWPGMQGLILLLDEDGKHLHVGAAVSLPKEYVQSIEGLEIGPMVGSCGTACYRRERVIVEDILTDPRWESLRDLATQYGLRACWSEPVFSSAGQVVGTFAMYYRQPRAPTEAELNATETAAHLVGVAVEHHRVQQALRESEEKFREIVEYANVGFTIVQDVRFQFVNPHYANMHGYTVEEMLHTEFMGYCAPEERERIVDFHTRRMRGEDIPTRYETAVMHKDGGRVYVDVSVGFIQYAGRPATFVFLRDITKQRQAQDALQVAYQTLERRVEERTRELAAINAVSAVVSRSLDLREIASDALDKTLEVVGMDLGVAYRLGGNVDEPAEHLVLNTIAYRNISAELARGVDPLPLQGSFVEKAAAAGQPVVWSVADYPVGPRKQALEREGVHAGVSVPLLAKGKLVGAIVLGTRGARSFAAEELSLLAAIGQQVGMAVENARLYEQAEQTAAFAERSRLARELHDSVTQSLYSVTMYAEAAARLLATGDTSTAADYLRELRDTAQEALREMRLLIFELRPQALEKGGLAAAIQARLETVEERAGVKTELQVEGVENPPFTVQQELYHIAREALNNVLKHAHAQHVRVCLRFQAGATSLEVRDDGVGFEPVTVRARGGMGLPGMEERAQRLGGALQVESMPGEGTTIALQVPMNPGSSDSGR